MSDSLFNSAWVNDTRIIALERNSIFPSDNSIRFYDWDTAASTLVEDVGAEINIPLANHLIHNPAFNTLLGYDTVPYQGSTTEGFTLYVTTDDGTGYTTQTVTMNITGVNPFGGFSSHKAVAISDDGLTIAMGNPLSGSVGDPTGNSDGGCYIFERLNLSTNFDFTTPDYVIGGSITNSKQGNLVYISGDGTQVIAEASLSTADPIILQNNGSWTVDSNTLPLVNGAKPELFRGGWLNLHRHIVTCV